MRKLTWIGVWRMFFSFPHYQALQQLQRLLNATASLVCGREIAKSTDSFQLVPAATLASSLTSTSQTLSSAVIGISWFGSACRVDLAFDVCRDISAWRERRVLWLRLRAKLTLFTEGSTVTSPFSVCSRARAVSDFGPYVSLCLYDIHRTTVLLLSVWSRERCGIDVTHETTVKIHPGQSNTTEAIARPLSLYLRGGLMVDRAMASASAVFAVIDAES